MNKLQSLPHKTPAGLNLSLIRGFLPYTITILVQVSYFNFFIFLSKPLTTHITLSSILQPLPITSSLAGRHNLHPKPAKTVLVGYMQFYIKVRKLLYFFLKISR